MQRALPQLRAKVAAYTEAKMAAQAAMHMAPASSTTSGAIAPSAAAASATR